MGKGVEEQANPIEPISKAMKLKEITRTFSVSFRQNKLIPAEKKSEFQRCRFFNLWIVKEEEKEDAFTINLFVFRCSFITGTITHISS